LSGSYYLCCTFVYAMMPPLRSFSRMHEALPTVSVEAGDTVYCRMRYCDFRFPLPDKVRIVRTDPVSGGFDTINGTIYLVGSDGGPVPMRAYAELLQRKHFDVSVADGTGCECCTNVPDVPFVSTGRVIHYPISQILRLAQAVKSAEWYRSKQQTR